jgi:arylsulfatase A-like enzyme
MRCCRVLLSTLVLAALATGSVPLGRTAAALPAKPNVLFIAIDDLNHWVGYLGRNNQVKTPNLDRIARRGLRFTRSYCTAPVCNPSRAALMSGLLPSTSGVYDNGTDWRPLIPESLTILTQFRKNGYFVGGAGKIYHEAFRRSSEWDAYFEQEGVDPKPAPPTDPAQRVGPRPDYPGIGGIKFAPLDCKDEDTQDYRIVGWAIEQLAKKHDKPFFLAAGVHKPHMPWNVPRKYYDMYPLDSVKLPPVLESDLNDVPPAGVKMADPGGDHADIVKSGRWKEAVQGYLAAISFTDSNVGRLFDALERSPYRDNTIVVVFGDHGWHLGEKLHWRKFTLWEEGARAPLIWIVPGVTKAGSVCDRTVDFMSIYPTLMELCGLPTPKHVQGVSIRKLLEQPQSAWDRPALTTYLFGNHAVRTEKWRYIRYHDGGEELYDETKDPLEWTNLAGKPEHATLKAQLAAHMPKVNAPPGSPRTAAALEGKLGERARLRALEREAR